MTGLIWNISCRSGIVLFQQDGVLDYCSVTLCHAAVWKRRGDSSAHRDRLFEVRARTALKHSRIKSVTQVVFRIIQIHDVLLRERKLSPSFDFEH